MDRWRFGTLAFGTLCSIWLPKIAKNYFQRAMIIVFETILSLTYIIILLVYFLIISKPYDYLIDLDKGTFVAVIIIAWNSIKVRVFKIIRFILAWNKY